MDFCKCSRTRKNVNGLYLSMNKIRYMLCRSLLIQKYCTKTIPLIQYTNMPIYYSSSSGSFSTSVPGRTNLPFSSRVISLPSARMTRIAPSSS